MRDETATLGDAAVRGNKRCEGISGMLTSKLAWLALRIGCKMGVFDSVWQWMLRLLARLLQFALCLAALILLSTGFVVGSFQGRSTMLGSRYVLVTAILTFLGMVYSFWWFVFIELLRMSERPRWFYTFLLDLAIALSLLIAAIVLLLSDFVANCLSFGHFLRCYNLNASVILMFLAMASFLVTPWMEYRWRKQQRAATEASPSRDSYQPASTPAPAARTHENTPERRV